jgi:hypothetical protein
MTMSHKEFSHAEVFTVDLDKTCECHKGVMTITTQRMLAEVRKLGPDIISRGAEIEALRHIPSDLLEALREIGIFRMFVPRSHGGLELDLPSAVEIIRALANIDGSIGWNAMIGSGGGIFAPLLPREIYDRIYENGPGAPPGLLDAPECIVGGGDPCSVSETDNRWHEVSTGLDRPFRVHPPD